MYIPMRGRTCGMDPPDSAITKRPLAAIARAALSDTCCNGSMIS